jgi:hypothetical protein
MGGNPGNDEAGVGYSLANVAEILLALLDAVSAKAVVEIGAYRGELTRDLLDWAAPVGATVAAVDPLPPPQLVELGEQHPELELVRETSHQALRHIPLPDAVIIDGDHNYYTLAGELELIDKRAPGASGPLLLFHDVGWPLARRDSYHAPERIPEQYRQPLTPGTGLSPEPSFGDDRPFAWTADHEGGPSNGILTAIEDHMSRREDLRLALVPAFFGFGVLWHRDAPWAGAVNDIVAPWDRHPVLERLEANRVAHLIREQVQARELEGLRQRNAQQEQLLRVMLNSKSFALAERLSRLRWRGRPPFSRRAVMETLAESPPDADS